jgi:hypothetical protein
MLRLGDFSGVDVGDDALSIDRSEPVPSRFRIFPMTAYIRCFLSPSSPHVYIMVVLACLFFYVRDNLDALAYIDYTPSSIISKHQDLSPLVAPS